MSMETQHFKIWVGHRNSFEACTTVMEVSAENTRHCPNQTSPFGLVAMVTLLSGSLVILGCGDDRGGKGQVEPVSTDANRDVRPTGEMPVHVPRAESPIDFSELDDYLNRNRKLFRTTAVLIRKNGTVVYSYGDVDVPVSAASCSKWLGAATIMKLVEKKYLDLDKKVGSYLRMQPDKQVKNLRKRVRQLTLRQLLSHTGGLRDQDSQNNGFSDGVSPVPPYRSIFDKLTFLRTDDDTPGFCYENMGFNFAGEVATRVARKSWPTVFQNEISDPLGMTHTSFYKRRPSLAAGAHSSASDYSRFLEMFRNNGVTPEGQRILSVASINEMLKNQTAGYTMRCVPRPSARKASYGLGMWRQGPDDRPWLASHFGTSGFKVFLDFCRDVSAVFVLEYKPKWKKQGQEYTRGIYDIVRRAIPVESACAREMERDDNQWTPPLRRPAKKRKFGAGISGLHLPSSPPLVPDTVLDTEALQSPPAAVDDAGNQDNEGNDNEAAH